MMRYLRIAGILILIQYPLVGFAFIACWLGLGHLPKEPLWQWLLAPFFIIG